MSDSNEPKRFYGKYRGTVAVNVDLEFRGRIMCFVPDVLGPGVPSGWCEPCLPLAGPTGTPMGAYLIPPLLSGVWVEFEQGDPAKPIWTGCRMGIGDAPLSGIANIPPVPPNIVLQSQLQHMIMISDMPPLPMMVPIPAPAPIATGGITLRSPTGAMIVVNDAGIFINNGKGAMITMIGPVIDFNTGALTILK